jgi:ferritin-like protein
MTHTPKATPIPIEYTDEGEAITVVITCSTCNFKSFDEVYDYCPKCLLKVNYIPPVDEDE